MSPHTISCKGYDHVSCSYPVLLSGSSSSSSSDDDESEVVPSYQKRKASPVNTRKNVASFAEHSDGYDDELYGDREDRERLLAMTEIDREALLYDRAQAVLMGKVFLYHTYLSV